MTKKIKILDGTEVEYVEVRDEPIHRYQFSNDYVYIYIVGFRPGDTSLWHRHSQDTFYVCIEHAVSALNRPSDKAPYVHHASPGDLWWSMSKNAPFVHQVCLLPENTNSSQFFAMEILKPPPVVSDSPLTHRCYKLRKDFSRAGLARVYEFKVEPGESTGPHSWNFYGVVVCLSDGGGKTDAVGDSDSDVQGRRGPFEDGVLSRVGGWKWVEGPVDIDVRNAGQRPYEAIVVEWLGESGEVDSVARL